MATGILTVKHYRWRNDDGSESSAHWKAAQDTNISLAVPSNTNIRLREVLLQGLQTASGLQVGLKVSHNGGAAAQVGPSSSYVQGVVSSNLADGNNTTEQLSLDSGDTWSAQPGVVNNTNAYNAAGHAYSLNAGNEMEAEWSLVLIASQLASGDTLDFTIFMQAGTDTITQFASNVRITIAGSTVTIEGEGAAGMASSCGGMMA